MSESLDSGAPEPSPEKSYVFDDPKNVQRLLRIFFASCAVLFLIDAIPLVAGLLAEPDAPSALDYKHHAHYGVEHWMGFYAIYGLVGCVALVLLAKVLRKIVMRPESYYGD